MKQEPVVASQWVPGMYARLLGWISRLTAGIVVAVLLLLVMELILSAFGFVYQRPSPIIVWNPAEDIELRSSESMHRFHPHGFGS